MSGVNNIISSFELLRKYNFFNLKNIEEVNSYTSVAREKEINGVPFFEIGTDFISGAQSSANLESIIRSNLS